MENITRLISGLEPKTKRRYLIALGVVVVVLGIWFSNFNTPKAPQAKPILSEVLAPANFMVHVAGAVVEPGLYEVATGSRVQDAVALAGGFADGAVESSVNLARMVSDGEQIVVLHQSQLSIGGSGGFISLNSATEAQLESLTGIGPAMAARIVEYRAQIGSFSSVEQLTEVPGIGSKLLEKIRDQLTL